MKKSAALLSLLLAAALCFSLTACGQKGTEGKYTIGIVQLVEHNALDAATRGFQDAVIEVLGEENVTFDLQNAQGEPANCITIATKFVNDKVDLIMANATPAATAAAQATATIPIVATSITDFVAAKLVESNEKPGRNVTGTSDLSDVAQQVALLQELCPEAKTVGIVYCSAEDNSIVQAAQAKEVFEAAGYTFYTYTATDANDLQAVVTKASGDCDALYLPTDNLLAANMELVRNITQPDKTPVICAEEGMVMEGGLASYSINYYTLGYKAGKMAAEILKDGKKPADMPIQWMTTEELNPVINEAVAEALGIALTR